MFTSDCSLLPLSLQFCLASLSTHPFASLPLFLLLDWLVLVVPGGSGCLGLSQECYAQLMPRAPGKGYLRLAAHPGPMALDWGFISGMVCQSVSYGAGLGGGVSSYFIFIITFSLLPLVGSNLSNSTLWLDLTTHTTQSRRHSGCICPPSKNVIMSKVERCSPKPLGCWRKCLLK